MKIFVKIYENYNIKKGGLILSRYAVIDETILNNILDLFKNSQKSDAELEREIGLPQKSIYEWRKGRTKSYKKYIDKIAKFFNVPAEHILNLSFYHDIGYIIREERNSQSITLKELANQIGISEKTLSEYERDYKPIPEITFERIANALGFSVAAFLNKYNLYDEIPDQFEGDADAYEAFLEAERRDRERELDIKSKTSNKWLKENAYPVDSVAYLPIVGRVAAGNGVIAQEEIIGYEFIDAEELCSGETYFWLRVNGDSMSPKIEDGDLVLVKQQSSVDSGSYAVVIIDGEDGVVKKVNYGPDWIELISINPYYPPRRFEGPDVLKITVVGKVLEVRRKL